MSSNSSNDILSDTNELQQQPSSPEAVTNRTMTTTLDVVDNIDNYLITTEINESGKFLTMLLV